MHIYHGHSMDKTSGSKILLIVNRESEQGEPADDIGWHCNNASVNQIYGMPQDCSLFFIHLTLCKEQQDFQKHIKTLPASSWSIH